jgi:hypothetical protein
MLILLGLVQFHVPTFGGDSTCVTPPHAHTTSQAFYFKGSAGIEVHIKSDTDPFDTLGGELIDVDTVLRDEIDPSTYSLHIGCGGCAHGDPIVAPRVNVTEYEHAKLEPFSQSWTRSVYPGVEWPKFNASALSAASCPQKHFTLRIVDHLNRTGDDGIVYALVLGKAEQFSTGELFRFPQFALHIHDFWNQAGWTAWVYFFLAPLLLLGVVYAIDSCFPSSAAMLLADIFTTERVWENYNLWFALSLHGYMWSALECFTHMFLGQSKGPVGSGFGLFLALPFLWGHVVPLVWLVASWWGVRCPAEAGPGWSSLWIGLADMTLGVLMLFYGLGGGFWVGPFGLIAAGAAKLLKMANNGPASRFTQRVRLEPSTTGSSVGDGAAYTPLPLLNLKSEA